MADLNFLPVHEIAEAIQNRKVSSQEALQAHLDQIARHNSSINAIVTMDEGQARQRVRETDEPLAHDHV